MSWMPGGNRVTLTNLSCNSRHAKEYQKTRIDLGSQLQMINLPFTIMSYRGTAV